jgi:hypothetical protein
LNTQTNHNNSNEDNCGNTPVPAASHLFGRNYTRSCGKKIATKKTDINNATETKRKPKGLTPKERSQQYRNNKKNYVQVLLANAFELFPTHLLKTGGANCVGDPNNDYGGHVCILKFPLSPGTRVGSRSFGLRYENEHHVKGDKVMCLSSTANLEFLLCLKDSIYAAHPALRSKSPGMFMRADIILGARTSEHTDTMRGATVNFFAVEPGNNTFTLIERLFPNFRDSVVKYKGSLYIPHKICDEGLRLIGMKDGQAHFFLLPKAEVNNLEAFGDLKDFIVVGIKQAKLQVISHEPEVIWSTRDLPLKSFDELVQHATEHSAKKPHKCFKSHNGGGKWHTFCGWRRAHQWLPVGEHLCKRIHVFYRLMREETPTARISYKNPKFSIMKTR